MRCYTLQNARQLLIAHNIENAPLTAEVLLRHTLNLDRVRYYQEFDSELTPEQESRFLSLVGRHIKGEPVAYITGHKEFFGIEFDVDSRALIPRPETELLVEKALDIAKERSIRTIADIGTGSGAITIALARKLPAIKIYASDISGLALELALQNCYKCEVLDKICLLEGDMLEPLPEAVDLIIANLPYVKEADMSEPSIMFEPALALNGGPDGLDRIRRFCPQIKEKLNPGGYLVMEMGLGQKKAVIDLLKAYLHSANIEVIRDINGIERAVYVSI